MKFMFASCTSETAAFLWYSGPTMFLVLNREDAVSGWRDLMGPTDPVVARDSDPDT